MAYGIRFIAIANYLKKFTNQGDRSITRRFSIGQNCIWKVCSSMDYKTAREKISSMKELMKMIKSMNKLETENMKKKIERTKIKMPRV